MAVRIVDVVALALVLLCGLCAAYNSMDLAELLRGRQRLAEQKRAMDGTSFSSAFSFTPSPNGFCTIHKGKLWACPKNHFDPFFQCLFLLVIENLLKNKMSKRKRITRWNGQFTEYSLQNRPWVILFYFNGNRSLRRDFDDKLETNYLP